MDIWTILYSSIQQIQVLNDREFIILLNYPDHELEIGLTNPLMSILKRENNKIFTSGRYAIEEIEKNKIKLKKINIILIKVLYLKMLK